MEEVTVEEIAQHYSALGDSVDLINEYTSSPPDDLSADEVADAISRNKEHLVIMLAKDFWTTEDMTAATAAAA
tara:strand:- start:348 stop:566 length:219 start_codon:yes stop_codon:yes gene_type:complete